MPRKRGRIPRPSPEVQKTIDLTTGIVGLQVAQTAALGLGPTPAGVITMGGTLPIAATSLMGLAGRDYRRKKK